MAYHGPGGCGLAHAGCCHKLQDVRSSFIIVSVFSKVLVVVYLYRKHVIVRLLCLGLPCASCPKLTISSSRGSSCSIIDRCP
jgi:hypothetical protein